MNEAAAMLTANIVFYMRPVGDFFWLHSELLLDGLREAHTACKKNLLWKVKFSILEQVKEEKPKVLKWVTK